ncbi:hypothetical protein [Streptomyces broussonetiae]|uniref:Delta-aminolevulinic acid dehydratase n=1 Tax=Streptomyces broussonetiae TaxID=2686304 RepID=A0A6I6NBE0_9ACTN|nr:hypothetical protein [Streptomyces broussonetiae]QHA08714.1 hypothetical protein GQF42_40495 [Streptomyces broussonetiae]
MTRVPGTLAVPLLDQQAPIEAPIACQAFGTPPDGHAADRYDVRLCGVDGAGSLVHGDRRNHQQDPAGRREGLRGAATSGVPVRACQTRGEHIGIEAPAAPGWIGRDRAVPETTTAVRRAGADAVLTYWAVEPATRLIEP